MCDSNYLVKFLRDVDILISEMDKLNGKIRLYRKNCNMFKINYSVNFTISPDSFVNLRNFLAQKIDENIGYDKKIVDLRREFLRNFDFLMKSIKKEITRINDIQELELNSIVYKAVYDAKVENEIKLRNSFDVKNSIFDVLLGISKFRKLSMENHDLKAKLYEKEYLEQKNDRKSIFELVNLINNCEVKTGSLLCLQEDIIKAFMLEKKNTKEKNNSWKVAMPIPYGFRAKRNYYKVLNSNLNKQNEELREKLLNDRSRELENGSWKLDVGCVVASSKKLQDKCLNVTVQ